ncbi:hypothetical protein [Alteromonas genovensis]|jgi:hypothetical protein|uniref:hypothetical protein n=1 Tax=Alteromonas genovensis TaxID=471225 RepID=UPI001942B32F|nr:hypothetical protein [Alteromonas genovensis]
MFTRRNLITALLLTSGTFSASLMANDNVSALQSHTDYLVASAMNEVRQETSTRITFDVMTASHTFEPDADESMTLIADIQVVDISSMPMSPLASEDSPEASDDNDA